MIWENLARYLLFRGMLEIVGWRAVGSVAAGLVVYPGLLYGA